MELPLNIPVIDCHVHAYPADVGRAVQASMGHTNPESDGTPEDLLRTLSNISSSPDNGAILKNMTPTAEMAKAAWDRVDRRLSPEEERQMYADVRRTIAGRIRRRNAWGNEVAQRYPTLKNFIGVDPNFMTAQENAEELELRVQGGASGIALHPNRNLHRADDRRLWPVYERAQELGLPVLTHGGAEGYRAAYMGLNTEPFDFLDVLDAFPRLTLILGHLGHGYFDQTREIARRYPNVWFETSGPVSTRQPYEASDEELTELLRTIGVERVVFGSDFVFADVRSALDRVLGLPLTDTEKEQILGGNAKRLLAR